MTINWVDGSSYSRGQQTSNIWLVEIGPLFISVVYDHILYTGQWIFSCEPFFEHEELDASDATEAKEKAIELVKLALQDALKKIGGGDIKC